MALPTISLIEAIRETARRLEKGAPYAWGHHGCCNCGNLLQVITNQSGTEILRQARSGNGEWTEIAEDYCEDSGLPVDTLVGELMKLGLTPVDIHHIEYLDDRTVLEQLPGGFRWLSRNKREDAILYLYTYAALLEAQCAKASKPKPVSLKTWEMAGDAMIFEPSPA